MRFEVLGTKIGDATNLLDTPVDILKWTPVAWAP